MPDDLRTQRDGNRAAAVRRYLAAVRQTAELADEDNLIVDYQAAMLAVLEFHHQHLAHLAGAVDHELANLRYRAQHE